MELNNDNKQVILSMDEYSFMRTRLEEMPVVEISEDVSHKYLHWFSEFGFPPPDMIRKYTVTNDMALSKLQKINDDNLANIAKLTDLLEKNPAFLPKTTLGAKLKFLFTGKLTK